MKNFFIMHGNETFNINCSPAVKEQLMRNITTELTSFGARFSLSFPKNNSIKINYNCGYNGALSIRYPSLMMVVTTLKITANSNSQLVINYKCRPSYLFMALWAVVPIVFFIYAPFDMHFYSVFLVIIFAIGLFLFRSAPKNELACLLKKAVKKLSK